ncbi:MAG TPA: DUF1080 domain-containing protein [Paludibaculum sp.]|jgi:hypothetical protein
MFSAALVLLLMLQPAPAPAPAWVSLFDGVSPAGWQEVTGRAFPTNCWKVEEGCLRAIVVKEGGFQDIRTIRTFREFELEFEWRIEPGGNSGVKYLIEKVDEWQRKDGRMARGRGPEYQLIDDDVNPDSKGNPAKQTASLYGKLAPSQRLAKPAGEFNLSRIVVRDGHVEHWLNGVKVLQYDRQMVESPIVLQNHSSAVWFRKIRVLDLIR